MCSYVSSKCRTCLSDSNFFHELFDYVDENYKILEILDSIVPQIDIKCNAQFSTLICQTCVDKLLTGYKFQQLCIETNNRLHDLLGIAGFKTEPKLEKVDPLTEEISFIIKQEIQDDVYYEQEIKPDGFIPRWDNDEDLEAPASRGSESKKNNKSLSAHNKVCRKKHDKKGCKNTKVDKIEKLETENHAEQNEPTVCVKEEYKITPQILEDSLHDSETNGDFFKNEDSEYKSIRGLCVKPIKSNNPNFMDTGICEIKRARKKRLTTSQKDLLIHDRENGMKIKELCVKYQLSESGVKRIIALYKIRKSNESLKKLCGRKRKTTKKIDEYIAIIAKNTFTSSKVIKEELNLNISPRTIQRRLNESGLKSNFVIKKPLSAENIKERLEFANKYINMPEAFWNKVIWTGEYKFEFTNTKKLRRYWREPSQSLGTENIAHTAEDVEEGLMVWGCFSSSGVGKLVKINTKMTDEDYVNILRENLYCSAVEIGLDDFIVQQNYSKHTSDMAKKYFEQNNIETLDWPAQNHDLNPIAHLWKILIDKISMDSRTNMQTLWEKIHIEWRAIPPTTLNNLALSMPKRLKEIIQNKGGAISY